MQRLINTTAGFLSESILKIPNRRFVPDCLIQTVVGGGNLRELGCMSPKIQGSSIAFDQVQSSKAAMGEFVERYASAMYQSGSFIVSDMESLKGQHKFLPLSAFKYYSDEQYRQLQSYGIKPLASDDVIEWTEAFDYISGDRYLIPAFSVYMPFVSRLPNAREYMVGATSTGIAAGGRLKEALISGFCECAERHAFAQFWYRQEHIGYKQYTSRLILERYRRNVRIKRLFDNPLVKMKVFDLSPFAPIETMVVFLYFQYKGRHYQSLGCAARFTKEEAIIKAALEAYQGVEYAISLMDKRILPEEVDLTQINDFDAHFHFYNQYPEYRKESKILREAQDYLHGDDDIYQDKSKELRSFNPESLRNLGLQHLIFKDITPIDVDMIHFKVARVITPGWSLLTGQHAWPFLGQNFQEDEPLFLSYPHPFP